MAEQLIRLKLCDMHLAGDEPDTEATEVRNVPNGKFIDLCMWCAFYYDIFLSHREQLMWRMTDETWERLMHSAREPENARKPTKAAQAALAAYAEEEETLEISATLDDRAEELRRVEDEIKEKKQQLETLRSDPPTAHEQTMLPQEPEPAPPPILERVYTDGKRRLRCMECPGSAPLLKSSAGSHARLVHGRDLQDVKFEGVGFKYNHAAKLGSKVRGVPSVICREKHGTGTADPFWVAESKRSGHARSSHPDKEHIAEVDYENAMKIAFEVRCKEHPWCAQADGGRGYGFLNAHAHATHMRKESERAAREAAALRDNNQA